MLKWKIWHKMLYTKPTTLFRVGGGRELLYLSNSLKIVLLVGWKELSKTVLSLIVLKPYPVRLYFIPANCGKTFLIQPLKKIFECFVNPACWNFSWLGIETAEVVLLNDFRWKPSLIPWYQFLQVLEGDTVNFPTPKYQMSKDIVFGKDTPFFATSDAPLVLINNGCIDRVNTDMMSVRWQMFQLHRQILCDEQRNITPCGRCFAEFLC